MLKIQMDCCVQIHNTAKDNTDKIIVQCPHCDHLTEYDFNKAENRCTECTIIINEEEVYPDVFPKD